MSVLRTDRTRAGNFFLRATQRAQMVEEKMLEKNIRLTNVLIGSLLIVALLVMLHGFISSVLSRNPDQVTNEIWAILIASLTLIFVVPVALNLGYPAFDHFRQRSHRRNFKEEIRQTAWMRFVNMDVHATLVLCDERFKKKNEGLNRFRLAFADMLKEHLNEDPDFIPAFTELAKLRSRKQWAQLEALSPSRFEHEEKDGIWKVSSGFIHEDIRGMMAYLFKQTTHVPESPKEAPKEVWIFDHEREISALADLAEAVRKSEHYGLDDFLTLANEAIRFVDHNVPTFLSPISIVKTDTSGIKSAYWRSEAAKVNEVSDQCFSLNTELIIKMVDSEVEESFADMVK